MGEAAGAVSVEYALGDVTPLQTIATPLCSTYEMTSSKPIRFTLPRVAKVSNSSNGYP